MLRRARLALLISAIAVSRLGVVPCESRAQAPAPQPSGSYDSGALRIQQTFWSTKLVQGVSAAPVASMGMFPPQIDLLASSGDSVVRRLHREFRAAGNRGTVLSMLGVAATIGSVVVYVGSDYGGPDAGPAALLLIGGTGLVIMGGAERLRSMDRLHQAVWLYNRQYAR